MTSLVQRRDYLAGQRRTILARSIAGSIAGAVPLPFLDDWALERIVGGGYKLIANAQHVDIDDAAVRALVHGKTPPPSLVDIAAGGIILRTATRATRRMLVALTAINRARSAARTFVSMTLFDHYCAKLHVGLALDGPTALLLRGDIDRTIDNTPGALSFHPFRRAMLGAARATLRAPLELADLASGGGLRRMIARRSEGEVTDGEAVDAALDTALTNPSGFLGRTVSAVEAQLSSEVNPFLDAAIESLDRRWRARMPKP